MRNAFSAGLNCTVTVLKYRSSYILKTVSRTLLSETRYNAPCCGCGYSTLTTSATYQRTDILSTSNYSPSGKSKCQQFLPVTCREYADIANQVKNRVKSDAKKTQKEKDDRRINKTQTKKTLNLDFSGDLQKAWQYDPKEIFFPYQDLEELKNAPETVQRICTLEFADRTQKKFHKIHETKKKIEAVIGVNYGREMIIANMTLQIRAMLPHVDRCRKDIRSKIFLYEKVAKRKKEIKRLRREDYVSFIWLLKLLQIKYVPAKPYSGSESRFARKKREAREEATEIKRQALEELREKLSQEKKDFLMHKQKILADVEEKIEKYDLNKKEIIQSVEKKRLERIKSRKAV